MIVSLRWVYWLPAESLAACVSTYTAQGKHVVIPKNPTLYLSRIYTVRVYSKSPCFLVPRMRIVDRIYK